MIDPIYWKLRAQDAEARLARILRLYLLAVVIALICLAINLTLLWHFYS